MLFISPLNAFQSETNCCFELDTMKKILVVDDNDEILKVIEIILNLEGYEVKCWDNGDLSLVVHEFQPDLILLDIMLGSTDGRELCRELKSQKETMHIPVIIISASHTIYSSGENNCKADAFIPKPFDVGYLVTQVDAYVN